MEIDWGTVLATFGLTTVTLIGALKFFGDKLLTHRLAKDLDKFRAELTHSLAKDLDKYRADLVVVSTTRTEVAKKRMEKVMEFVRVMENARTANDSDPYELEEREAYEDVEVLVAQIRPLVTQEASDEIDRFLDRIPVKSLDESNSLKADVHAFARRQLYI